MYGNEIPPVPRRERRRRYTSVGGGCNVGWSANPLPLDIMRTTGKGEPNEVFVHDSVDDEKHFLGKAMVDQISEGVFITYRGRSHHHRPVMELKMPAQIQAPSMNGLKRFNGSVRSGYLR